MLHVPRLLEEFFVKLAKIDEWIAAAVAADGCSQCNGPLHKGNYHRKPRGGLIAVAGESLTIRHSLCCGRRGCRKRALPPSLRFLGRRVYLEAVVALASVFAQVMASLRKATAASGVPARTLRRWRWWWRQVFPALPTWIELKAQFIPPPPDETRLPHSLLARIERELRAGGEEPTAAEVMLSTACCLAPATSGSGVDGSRFVRAYFGQTAGS